NKVLARIHHLLDLVLVYLPVVGVRNLLIRRPDHRHGADRNDDVAVGRHLAPVDHRVHQPVVHGDHDALAREHVALAARHARAPPPLPPRPAIPPAHAPEAFTT